MKPKTRKVPFDIYLPVTETEEPQYLETIEIEVYEQFGEDFITTESSELIESITMRKLGRLRGPDIKALRERLELTQDQFSEALGSGLKSLSRWENGRGTPSALVNKLLRLLHDGHTTLAQLRAVEGPIPDPQSSFLNKRPSNVVHYQFRNTKPSKADLAALLPDDPELKTY